MKHPLHVTCAHRKSHLGQIDFKLPLRHHVTLGRPRLTPRRQDPHLQHRLAARQGLATAPLHLPACLRPDTAPHASPCSHATPHAYYTNSPVANPISLPALHSPGPPASSPPRLASPPCPPTAPPRPAPPAPASTLCPHLPSPRPPRPVAHRPGAAADPSWVMTVTPTQRHRHPRRAPMAPRPTPCPSPASRIAARRWTARSIDCG